MSAGPAVSLTARPPNRLVHPVLEPHDGRAQEPIPERSTSPRATSTLQQWIVRKRLTQTGRLEKRTLRHLSITSSARVNSGAGTVSPRAFAALRLIVSSN